MPSPITPLLEQAHAALARHEPALALASLLRAWSAVRAAELGDLIERLSSRLASTRPTPTGKTRAELEHSWRELAERADAVELGVLLPSLVDTDSHQARRRLKLVVRHAPDPRIASVLCSTILAPPFTASSTAKFWQTLHELLCACPDPRALARLEQAPPVDPLGSSTVKRLDAWRARSVERLHALLQALPTELAPDDRARVQTIGTMLDQARAAPHDAGPELLAAIFEAPDELDRRQVYADYLLSIGDPRGEFIALQLAELRGTLDRAGKARAKALLSEHGNAWLGNVGRALVRDSVRFVAGFLSAARVKQHHRGLERLIGDPVWATVETLDHAPPELVRDPIMRSLLSIHWSDYQLFAAVEQPLSLPKLEHLRVDIPTWHAQALQRALEPAERWPRLRSVALDMHEHLELEQLAWLWSGALGRRLHRVQLSLGGSSGLGLASYLRSLRSAQPVELTELVLDNHLLRCRFTRHDGEWLRVELSGELQALGMERHLLEQLGLLDMKIELVSS